MMPWLLFGGTLIAAIFLGYQIVVSHTEEKLSLESKLGYAEARVKLMTKSIGKKNAYIKILEQSAVENASPDAITSMLNNMFMPEDADGSGDEAVPDKPETD